MLRLAWRWTLRAILLLAAVTAIYIGALVYPTPWFGHAARFGDYRVYSDQPIPESFSRVVDEAARRVAAMEYPLHRAAPRIYLCNSRRRYGMFAFLLRKDPETLAIGVSMANEIFVSMRRLEDFAAANGGFLRHTRFEGDPAEAIAHEIAHFVSLHALGLRRHLAQPMWKSEGWAEYQANLAAIRDDPAYDLAERIDQLLDDTHWGNAYGLARVLWESQLLVEYLGEVEGYRLEDLSREDVTRAATRERMLAWQRDPRELDARAL